MWSHRINQVNGLKKVKEYHRRQLTLTRAAIGVWTTTAHWLFPVQYTRPAVVTSFNTSYICRKKDRRHWWSLSMNKKRPNLSLWYIWMLRADYSKVECEGSELHVTLPTLRYPQTFTHIEVCAFSNQLLSRVCVGGLPCTYIGTHPRAWASDNDNIGNSCRQMYH